MGWNLLLIVINGFVLCFWCLSVYFVCSYICLLYFVFVHNIHICFLQNIQSLIDEYYEICWWWYCHTTNKLVVQHSFILCWIVCLPRKQNNLTQWIFKKQGRMYEHQAFLSHTHEYIFWLFVASSILTIKFYSQLDVV